MSHLFIVPTNENGLVLDQNIDSDVTLAMSPVFNFNDVFIYSHGWWTDAILAMEGYNRFTIEFSNVFRSTPALATLQTLGIGIHWPSTLSEDQFSLANYFESLSFYTMEKRSDTVGENTVYTLLRLALNARQQGANPWRIHLLGHSFVCKVVCRGLQRLIDAGNVNPIPAGVAFDVVLLQAAFDNDELEADNNYGGVPAGLPGLRLLITRSDADKALETMYPAAHQMARLIGENKPALGAAGPTTATTDRFGGATAVDVGPGYDGGAAGSLAGRLVVADLTRLHQAHPENEDHFSGHHSDIFLPEIYRLLKRFYFDA